MSTPETEMPEKKSGGFLGWVSDHKWWVLGGTGVLAVGIYVYEKHKSSTASSATATTASSLPTGSGVPSYSSAPTGNVSPGGTGGYSGAAGSQFAGQLANDFSTDVASSLAKYASIRGTSPVGTTPGSSQAAQPVAAAPSATPVTPKATVGVPAAVTAAATGTAGQGTAISPPSSITLKGVKFSPSREVQYQNANWYGIPNAKIAASLEKAGVTVKNILGGAGLYAKG